MLNLILFGPPGSGKGTQSALLLERYNLLHISTGDLLRAERAAHTPLGIEAQKYMDQGLLVPDEVVIGMISNKLKETAHLVKGYIFDGFPRTVAQAEALDALLRQHNTAISAVLELEVPQPELIRRIIERGQASGRADDTEQTALQRIEEYRAKTVPVASHYAKLGKLISVNGEGSISDIAEVLNCEIDSIVSV